MPADELSGLVPALSGSKDSAAVSAAPTPRDRSDDAENGGSDGADGDAAAAADGDGSDGGSGGGEAKTQGDDNAPPAKLMKNQFSYSDRQSQVG